MDKKKVIDGNDGRPLTYPMAQYGIESIHFFY
jgi:hypothetical protein